VSGNADASGVARLQLLILVVLWLVAGAAFVRARIRRMPHRHWMAGLETLRRWDTPH